MSEKANHPPKARRGFALLTPDQRRSIASMGGKAVKPENRSFSQSRELASKAGRSGGTRSSRAKK